MSFTNSAKRIVQSIGKNNKPTYAVMAVAVTNGIFKPLSSLTDKKEAKETKQYAALREFLTEVVAVPTYWACGELAAKVAEKHFKNPKDIKMAKTNMMFLGVCTAALLVIPGLCSVIVTPFTDMIFNKKKPDTQSKKLDINEKAPILNIPMEGKAAKTKYMYPNHNMHTFVSGGLKI